MDLTVLISMSVIYYHVIQMQHVQMILGHIHAFVNQDFLAMGLTVKMLTSATRNTFVIQMQLVQIFREVTHVIATQVSLGMDLIV